MIIAADDKDVATWEDRIAAVNQHKRGDRITLTLLRGNAKQDVTVVVPDRPAGPPPAG